MFECLPGSKKTKHRTDEGNSTIYNGLDPFGKSVVYQIYSNVAFLSCRIRECEKNNDHLHQRYQFFSAKNAFAKNDPQQYIKGRDKNHEKKSAFCTGIK
jgi:hypothetical protein